MMPTDRYNRLLSANRELHSFEKRVDELVRGTGHIAAQDLRALGGLLRSMAPEICEPVSGGSGDARLGAVIREYVGNLRTLQTSIERVRCVMLARRAQMGAERQRLNRLHGWADAYRQTT